MATAEYSATLAASGSANSGSSNLVGGSLAATAAAATTSTHGAAFTTALGVLVADGALPTQAHVTACNNAWTTYKADIDAATTAGAAATADVTVYIGSLANVGTRTKFKAALDAIFHTVRGSNIMTA